MLRYNRFLLIFLTTQYDCFGKESCGYMLPFVMPFLGFKREQNTCTYWFSIRFLGIFFLQDAWGYLGHEATVDHGDMSDTKHWSIK